MVSAKTVAVLLLIAGFFFFGGGKFIKPAIEATKQIASNVKDITPSLKTKAEKRAEEIRAELK